MKKIFAIALALVMVLSMASAFAANCVTPNWDCAEDVCALGKGKVEVIPYVKGNDCNTGNTYTFSTCAGAVNGDTVYFAVKVTVDENPNPEWWADADLKFELKGLNTLKVGTVDADLTISNVDTLIKNLDTKGNELKAGEYYIGVKGTSYVAMKAADFSAKPANLFTATVTEAGIAKVCAVLDAENDFDRATVNGYLVTYDKDATNPTALMSFRKGDDYVNVYVDKDDKIVKFAVNGDEVTTYNHDGSKFWNNNSGKEMDWTCDAYGKFLKGVMDTFKLGFGTCITHKAVVANFGWDDEVRGCFSWNSDVQAVVNAECVVSIPKTGDVSVVAYAVMAVVAAAGAMLKK